MKQLLRIVTLGVCGVLIASCGSAVDKNLDDARFSLDSGNYDGAVTAASSAATSDPSNLNAFNLLSSAYSGKSGLDLLNLSKVLTDTANSDTIFNAMHTELVTELAHTGTDYGVGLSNLRTGITTLAIVRTTYTGAPTTYTGNTTSGNSVLNNQYFFQVGILMYIESLGLPTIRAQPGATGTAIDVTKIKGADTTDVQDDFINGYAALTNAATGIPTTNALATTLSKNYCVLNKATKAKGSTGVSQSCLQELTGCQLNTAYAGPFVCVTKCSDFDFSKCDGTTAPAL